MPIELAAATWFRTSVHLALTLLIASLIVPSGARAAGGGGGGSFGGGSSGSADSESQQERRAKRAYRSAQGELKKATRYATEARDEADSGKREKLEKKSAKEFAKAQKNLKKAIEMRPDFYEAYSDLGFALRSQGDYEASLTAYDKALSIQSDYAPAIEYRGEAYLELGQLDSAARAYQRLSRSSPELADQLLRKMQQWVKRKREDPGQTDPDVVESFGRWVDKRTAAHARGEVATNW